MGLLIRSSVADHQRVKKQRVDAADAAINEVAKRGCRFLPSDEDLVTYLCEKVYGGGESRSDRVLLGECDMFGDKEPWNIWNDHGGSKLNIKAGEDLYFFTKLNKVSNVNGSRNYKRRVGSGTWAGAYCRVVAGGLAKKRHFSYENKGCSEHHHAWIMHEYRLVDLSADYVLCRLRKKRNKVINNKNTGLVNDQTKKLALVNDQEIIKKQRLGVESECNDQVLEKILHETAGADDHSQLDVDCGKKVEDDSHMEEAEEHGSSPNNNVAKSTSGAAHLSQLDVDFGGVVEEDNDDEYLSGKKSYAELMKDIPLYYIETHDDQDDVLVDTIVDLL